MIEKIPRVVIAGLSGDSGKTIVSLSLLFALKQKGFKISVFKKGPDYIDPAWLSMVSDSVCRNLDTFLIDPKDNLETFMSNSVDSEIAVIEGNRGIFDGKDVSGTHSTAELAKLLQAPVILVVNCTKTTRTIAALINGCINFDPELKIAGIILNRVAGKRHEKIIKDSIEKECKIEVLGAIPKLGNDSTFIPGRHLGLITPYEFNQKIELQEKLKEIAEKYINIEKIIEISKKTSSVDIPKMDKKDTIIKKVKIGYFHDPVFTFYYPENLEALENNGAELIPISSLNDISLPNIDGLYVGGGFPETHAELLSQNRSLMISVKNAIELGMPVYAECGGLIYLSRSIKYNEKTFPMSDIFPIDLKLYSKPVGHGYIEGTIDKENPFLNIGSYFKGHEFHYSGLTNIPENDIGCIKLDYGNGIGNNRDGLLYKNCMACYSHIHAKSIKGWALSFVTAAVNYRKKNINLNGNSWNNTKNKEVA